jgi:hypothetical protein
MTIRLSGFCRTPGTLPTFITLTGYLLDCTVSPCPPIVLQKLLFGSVQTRTAKRIGGVKWGSSVVRSERFSAADLVRNNRPLGLS